MSTDEIKNMDSELPKAANTNRNKNEDSEQRSVGLQDKNDMRLGVKKCQWHFDSVAEMKKCQWHFDSAAENRRSQ